VALRVRDIVAAMERAASCRITSLRADGGMAANRTFVQIQSDILGLPVDVAPAIEATSIGMAHMAGLALGWWSIDDLRRSGGEWDRVGPDPAARYPLEHWRRAVERARGGAGGDSGEGSGGKRGGSFGEQSGGAGENLVNGGESTCD